jgi:hypothetical protein
MSEVMNIISRVPNADHHLPGVTALLCGRKSRLWLSADEAALHLTSLKEHWPLSYIYMRAENDTWVIFRILYFSQATDAVQTVPQYFHGDRSPIFKFSTNFVNHNYDNFDQISAHVVLSLISSFQNFIRFRDYWDFGLRPYSDILQSTKVNV